MPIKLLVASAFALVLAACNPMAQVDAADTAIDRFHATYNESDAEALYQLTAAEFRKETSPADMVALVSRVKSHMGPVEGTARQDLKIEERDGINMTLVTMTTDFALGQGTETFTFYGSDNELRLVGWNVDSPNFLDLPEEAVTTVEPAE